MQKLKFLGGVANINRIDTHVYFTGKLIYKWENDDTVYEVDFSPDVEAIEIECFMELVKRRIITKIQKTSEEEIFHQETYEETKAFVDKKCKIVWSTDEDYYPSDNLFFHVNVSLVKTDSVNFDLLFLGYKYPFSNISLPIEVFHEFLDRVKPRIRIKTIHAVRNLDVFIAYASEDKHFANKLSQDLTKRGFKIWFDEWEIKVGDSIIDKISLGISETAFMVVVFSSNSVEKDWVKKEINAGFMKEIEEKKIYLLPVLLEPCKIPPLLTGRKYADFYKSYDNGLTELLSKL